MENKISKATGATTFLHCIVGSINKKEKDGKITIYMRVATHRKINKVEKTDWHNVVAYGKLASIIDTYVEKGQRLSIEGEMEVWKFENEDDNGKKIITNKNYIKANKVDFKSEAMMSLIGFIGNVSRKDEDSPLYLKIQTNRKTYKDNEQVEVNDWHTATFYGKLADVMEQYAEKGKKIMVIGSLETLEFDDPDKENSKIEKTFIRARRAKFL